jgi:hypothetical protein
MRKRLISIITAFAALIAGCKETQQDQKAGQESEAAKSADKNLSIMVGVYSDGTPFFDWEGILQYFHESNGSLLWDDGATLKGDFKRSSDGAATSINIQARVEQGVYRISGTYSSSVPFTLTYLGTNQDDADDPAAAAFEAGEGKLEYRGELPGTFEKNR